MLAAVLAAVTITAAVKAQSAADAGPVVLFLVGEDPDTPYAQGLVEGVRSRLAEAPGAGLFIEFLDLLRFNSPGQRREIAGFLSVKFGGRRPDVVLAVGAGAVQVLATQLHQTWAGVPVVYVAMAETLPEAAPLTDVTALILENPIPSLFATVRALLPDSRRIALVLGASPVERSRAEWYKQLIRSAGLEPVDLGALPLDALRVRVSTLATDTALFVESVKVDGAGHVVAATDNCTAVHEVANRPMFMVGRVRLGCGIVGGPLADFRMAGRELAARALARVAGATPGTVVLPLQAYVRPAFDARELQRWGIAESRLPAGSEVLHRPHSLWREYRQEVLGTLAVAAALIVMASGLLAERRRRREAEGALRTSYAEAQELAARLISARDVERARTARVLRSELGTSLARLAADAERIRLQLGSASGAAQMAAGVSERAAGIAAELDDWSQRLHPSKLDALGLSAALRALCEELSRPEALRIECSATGEESVVPAPVRLCLFRVAQEALQNVLKHSGAVRAAVALRIDGKSAELRIADMGAGMPAGARGDGLGLVSMRERVGLVGGSIDIRSRRGRGTTITVQVPLTPS